MKTPEEYLDVFPGWRILSFGKEIDYDGEHGIENKFSDYDNDWEVWRVVENVTHWIPLPKPPKRPITD